ncbi:MAG: amino acid permease [Chthoniobacterales bacterium]
MNKKTLSLFALVMMNVAAIDSLRILPVSAEYGLSLIFYYVLAALLFFVPTALVSAELSTGWPETGAMYVWVREAFGPKFGFMIIWVQWISNIAWFPTIMSFIAATISYCIDPNLVNNKPYMITLIFCLFWGITFLNFFGIKTASLFGSLSVIFGTLAPMGFIIILGIIWMVMRKPLSITLSWHSLLPDVRSIDNMALLTVLLYSLVGIELSAAHAGEVKNPQQNYPKAIFWSVLIILGSLIFSSLAIALVVPQSQLNIIAGLLQAFEIFFNAFHLHGLMPLLALLITVGALGGLNSWILGPSKSLLMACHDDCLPQQLGKKNRHGVPVLILLLQGLIFSVLTALFLLMPTVSSGFLLLTNIASLLALLGYIAMFASAVKLRYKHPNVKRTFVTPGGKPGLWFICITGSLSCLFTMSLGFLPPSQIAVGNVLRYQLIIGFGILLGCLFPFFLYKAHKRSKGSHSQ